MYLCVHYLTEKYFKSSFSSTVSLLIALVFLSIRNKWQQAGPLPTFYFQMENMRKQKTSTFFSWSLPSPRIMTSAFPAPCHLEPFLVYHVKIIPLDFFPMTCLISAAMPGTKNKSSVICSCTPSPTKPLFSTPLDVWNKFWRRDTLLSAHCRVPWIIYNKLTECRLIHHCNSTETWWIITYEAETRKSPHQALRNFVY